MKSSKNSTTRNLILWSILLIILFIGLSFWGAPQTVEENLDNSTPESPITSDESTGPVIYVSIASHNEEPSLKQPDYLDEDLFWYYREGLVDMAKMLYEEDVMYDFQSDWNFLQAVAAYDNGTPSTSGKNVVLWLYENLEFAVDPHAHETKYNYADVAYLIEQLGVPPSGITGGFVASPASSSKVNYLQNPIEGWVYDYTWQAEAMWGGGTLNHVNEENLWISGIWRPKNNGNFYKDDPTAVPVIGRYRSDFDGLDDLLNKWEQGELEEDQIYTITIMNDQKLFSEEDDYIENFKEELEVYKSYTEQGIIEWVSLTEVLEIWETEFDSEPSQLFYAEFPKTF